CSHHFGRWRLDKEKGGERWLTARADLEEKGEGKYLLRQIEGAAAFKSDDPDSERIWWSEVGVHQNLTFPVHPDPLSGMHCWHQRVRVSKARIEDKYGDIFGDTEKAHKVYQEWLKMTRPGPGPGGLRRPLWLQRPFKPEEGAYYVK
ncbi:MAG: formate dehydrogenase, partial [Planctomycetota bacterium]|nr:formate dehydrogenase [Planctomycetota bacterium]